MTSNPRVTVLITTYNGTPELSDAIESVFRQEYTDYELLIINDGSTDCTSELLSKYNDPRMRIINQSNRGRARALARGLRLARGEYVAILDDDDLMDELRLRRQVEVLEASEDLAAVGSWYAVHQVDRNERRVIRPPTESSALRRCLPRCNPYAHSAVTFRKAEAIAVGGYNEHLGSCIDYDLWVRLAAAGHRLGMIDEVLCTLRRSEELSSFAFSTRERVGYYQTMFQIRLRAASQLDVPAWHYIWPPVMLLKHFFKKDVIPNIQLSTG